MVEGRRPGQCPWRGGRVQAVWGRPVSGSLSSQQLLPVPKAVLSLGPLELERRDPEVFLLDRLTGKEDSLEEVRGTSKGKWQEL